jgi:hypothetical protein
VASGGVEDSDMQVFLAGRTGRKMNGKISRKTGGVARVFLEKNSPGNRVFFAIKGLLRRVRRGGAGRHGHARRRLCQIDPKHPTFPPFPAACALSQRCRRSPVPPGRNPLEVGRARRARPWSLAKWPDPIPNPSNHSRAESQRRRDPNRNSLRRLTPSGWPHLPHR